MDAPPDPDRQAAEAAALEEIRGVARVLEDFRAEVFDKIRTDTENELTQLEADGFDPARGRGRGPHWIKDG